MPPIPTPPTLSLQRLRAILEAASPAGLDDPACAFTGREVEECLDLLEEVEFFLQCAPQPANADGKPEG
ncbi:MAG: hypothetical protein H6581_22540 [Bacteroidia bacterium]|nr:hypothetical protein [Bacteroidia bacterium]